MGIVSQGSRSPFVGTGVAGIGVLVNLSVVGCVSELGVGVRERLGITVTGCWEQFGEYHCHRGAQHGEAGADNSSVGLNSGPKSGHIGAMGLVVCLGRRVESCHTHD